MKMMLLHHFNSTYKIRLKTDASDFVINNILSQLTKNEN